MCAVCMFHVLSVTLRVPNHSGHAQCNFAVLLIFYTSCHTLEHQTPVSEVGDTFMHLRMFTCRALYLLYYTKWWYGEEGGRVFKLRGLANQIDHEREK